MDDRGRDGGTNSTLRTKEQGRHLTLNEHDDDDKQVPKDTKICQQKSVKTTARNKENNLHIECTVPQEENM